MYIYISESLDALKVYLSSHYLLGEQEIFKHELTTVPSGTIRFFENIISR